MCFSKQITDKVLAQWLRMVQLLCSTVHQIHWMLQKAWRQLRLDNQSSEEIAAQRITGEYHPQNDLSQKSNKIKLNCA